LCLRAHAHAALLVTRAIFDKSSRMIIEDVAEVASGANWEVPFAACLPNDFLQTTGALHCLQHAGHPLGIVQELRRIRQRGQPVHEPICFNDLQLGHP